MRHFGATDFPLSERRFALQHRSIGGHHTQLGHEARAPSGTGDDTLLVCLAHHRIDATDDGHHVG